MTNKIKKKRVLRGTGAIIGHGAGKPGKNLGGRPKGAKAQAGEVQVRKAAEMIITTGARRFKAGQLDGKQLGDLAKVIESYCTLLKRTGGDSSLSYKDLVDRMMQEGRPGAYEEIAGTFKPPKDSEEDLVPMDAIPSAFDEDEEAQLAEQYEAEGEDFFAVQEGDLEDLLEEE